MSGAGVQCEVPLSLVGDQTGPGTSTKFLFRLGGTWHDLPDGPLKIARLQDRLVETALRARALDLRSYEESRPEDLRSEVYPEVADILAEALTVLDALTDSLETEKSPPEDLDGFSVPDGSFLREIDALLEAAEDSQAIADIAFFSSRELHLRKSTVEQISASGDTWEIIGELGSALRKVYKAFTAIEAAICRQTDLSPVLGFSTELHRSLKVRRVYARFQEAIAGDAEPHHEELRERLRGVAVNIAKMIGRDIYSELRITDRVHLRELQHRVLGWLKRADPNPKTGMRLWQDCAGFAMLLREVNKRQELQQHDHQLIGKMKRCLAEMAADEAPIPENFLEQARPLYGMDAELDALIRRGTAVTPQEWQLALSMFHGSRS